MAHSSKSPQDFIQDVFRPMVAVLCSPTVDYIVHKNNLNFVELLQPFCNLNAEGQVRDPSGTQCIVRNWKLSISDVNTRPPQPTLAKKMLNEVVSKSSSPTSTVVSLGKHELEVPSSTPWFEEWRDTFFQVQYPSDHEFTKHYVACMIVATSSEPSASDTYAHMVQQLALLQNVTPPKLPKWFNSNVLRSYVLLHDMQEGNKDKADRAFESLKQTYGAGNCFFLAINSKSSTDVGNDYVQDIWLPHLHKRIDGNESGSEKSSLPRTPVDALVVSSMPSVVDTGSRALISNDGTISERYPEVSVHPLSPSEDTEYLTSFDNAISLQMNDTLRQSAEDVTSYINTNVWNVDAGLHNSTAGHGASLTSTDLENIKTFLNEFAFKALLPYFERQISQLHEAVANKKGVSRSLLSATKRWFGTNKPGMNHGINSVIYAPECPELQLRRLGDLWFLLGQWGNAFQAYHTAKREFNADNAWLCYAGALEMAALSAFMASECSKKTFDYMEESISIYLNTCRMPQFAVRATLLSMQCLTTKGFHGETAQQLIRMSSEDCDLRSAVLLEQAALCFVAAPPSRPLVRKYAFHMVLSGHRYSKAGQKKHALRCYNQAYQIYGSSGWRLAVDHVEFTAGRLAGQLGEHLGAVVRLAAPLAPNSPQQPAQQASLLREYMLAQQQWAETVGEKALTLMTLPLPLLQSNETKVLCGGIMPLSEPCKVAATGMTVHSEDYEDEILADEENIWIKLEKMLIHSAKGALPMIFKPSMSLFSSTTDNSTQPVSPHGEPIQVLFKLENPLQIPLNIMNIQLLWRYRRKSDSNGEEIIFSNENYFLSGEEVPSDVIASTNLSQVILQGSETSNVLLSVTPLHPGELSITGIAFRLSNSIHGASETTQCTVILGKQIFNIRGPILKNTKENAREPLYGVDRRLNIVITPSAPCLQVTFTEMSQELLCGEMQKVNLELRNVGCVALKSLYMGVSHPQCVSMATEGENLVPFSALIDEKFTNFPQDLDERQMQLEREKRARKRHCVKVLDLLGPGQTYCTDVWVQAPHSHGEHTLNVLFYYENSDPSAMPRHRLLRHTWKINVQESVQVSVVPRRSIRSTEGGHTAEEIMVLPVEVQNANQLHHLVQISAEVSDVSLLSLHWQLSKLVPLKVSDQTLKQNETMHLVAQAVPARTSSDPPSERLLSTSLQVGGKSDQPSASISESPYSRFVVDYESIAAVDHSSVKDTSLSANISINSTLVVRWTATIFSKERESRRVAGQHRLSLDIFNKRVSSPSNFSCVKVPSVIQLKLFGSEASGKSTVLDEVHHKSNENIAVYRLQHADQVQHDFNRKKLCIVPVKVHIVNCSKYSISTSLELSSRSSNTSASKFGWLGIVSGEHGGISSNIKPYKSVSVNLIAAMSNPGRYLIGNTFKLYCKILDMPDSDRSILQAYRSTSSLCVQPV